MERKYLVDEKQRLEQLTHQQNEDLKNLNASLEGKVADRTVALKNANDKLKENFLTSIKVFSALIEMRGEKLAGHSRRVADLARKIALKMAIKMGLSSTDLQDIFVAGLLVDIGKIGFPDELFDVPFNQLNSDQLGHFHKHTIRAEQVLMALEDLQVTAKILRSQHERVDGRGFPDKLVGTEIPLGARILAVASDYDQLQIGGLVLRKVPPDEAQGIIIRSAGSRYDEDVITAFRQLFHHDPDPIAEYDVAVKDLTPGMVLSRDLISRDGILLLPAEYNLSEGIIAKLQLYNASTGGHMSLKIRINWSTA